MRRRFVGFADCWKNTRPRISWRLVNELLGVKGLLLRTDTVVDATLIASPSSTKNASGERDPQMKQSKKGNQ